MKPIVLAGLPGAGKSTVGAALAARLGLRFIDIDQAIEQRSGATIAELFERIGESGFRALERALAAEQAGEQDVVIALGGGGFQDDATRALLLRRCITIWLDPPHEVLLERLRGATHRPMFGDSDAAPLLASLAAERGAAFAQAHVRITAHELEPAVGEITRKLAAHEESRCGPSS